MLGSIVFWNVINFPNKICGIIQITKLLLDIGIFVGEYIQNYFRGDVGLFIEFSSNCVKKLHDILSILT